MWFNHDELESALKKKPYLEFVLKKILDFECFFDVSASESMNIYPLPIRIIKWIITHPGLSRFPLSAAWRATTMWKGEPSSSKNSRAIANSFLKRMPFFIFHSLFSSKLFSNDLQWRWCRGGKVISHIIHFLESHNSHSHENCPCETERRSLNDTPILIYSLLSEIVTEEVSTVRFISFSFYSNA